MAGKQGGDAANKQTLSTVPFCSMIGSGFWHKFSDLVLDEVKLTRAKIPLWGQFTKSVAPNLFSVDYSSFGSQPSNERDTCYTRGSIINTNTNEEFKNIDKNELIQSEGQALVDLLSSADGLKEIEKNPQLLVPFFVLVYGNLKNYKYKYWFGFPALSSIKLVPEDAANILPFTDTDVESLFSLHSELVSSGFFVVDSTGTTPIFTSLEHGEISSNKRYAFIDTSSVNGHPSWTIRNYTVFIVAKHGLKNNDIVEVIGVSRWRSKISVNLYTFRVQFSDSYLTDPKIVGWERNQDGKLQPQEVDMQSSLDPSSLSESSIDFNLKLMKWRIFPSLDLEKIKNTRCLLFGAGTLGCNIARCLLGWGVRHIKFIDNSYVSYSNPVRQSLYTFEDCVQRKAKATAAAEALKRIFPGIDASGETLMVPMPGHPVSPATLPQVQKDFETVKQCVNDCDVIFLLMDTREARWLPTVMGCAEDKHGNAKNKLGCYFCTDVVAPGDSSRDRTLDQQCTVTRPGVSYIASAYAVELLMSMLHQDSEAPLGIAPHSIRGYLSSGEQLMPSFSAFDMCTACSPLIIDEYRKKQLDFVIEVMNNPQYLEVLSGVDKLKLDDDGIEELTDDEDSC